MADGARITFQDEEFTRVFREYSKATSKTLEGAINAKAKDVCFRAANAANTKTSTFPDRYPKESPLWHALAATGATKFGQAVKGQGNKKLARTIYNSRLRAKGYSRAIWRKIASDFGGALSGKASKIDHARGIKAKDSFKPEAQLIVDGLEQSHVDDVMQPAIDAALKYVAADMRLYLAKKMSKQRVKGVKMV